LTSNLSENPQKISGLSGMTLGAIFQAGATVVIGSIVGLIYGWKLALVGIAVIPFVFVAGYVRLRVVVMKDETNKQYHEDSAQMACEAAASIRTVAALTREKDCVDIYSRCLDIPLKKATRTSVYATATYALSQSMAFFAISLVFWYGSRLVANGEYSTTAFFVCLMSVTFGAIDAGELVLFIRKGRHVLTLCQDVLICARCLCRQRSCEEADPLA
jgi:ATP-binding cassette, subfamily B (MDR/TAP), member 1